jgi:hypothetical protein
VALNNKYMKKETKMSGGKMVAIGAGVAAATVAAYLLFGPNGKKNRKIVKGWMVKMKGEIIEKIENVKDITEPVYKSIVDKVASKYAGLKNIDQEEFTKVVSEIQKGWKNLSGGKKSAKKKAVKKSSSKKN